MDTRTSGRYCNLVTYVHDTFLKHSYQFLVGWWLVELSGHWYNRYTSCGCGCCFLILIASENESFHWQFEIIDWWALSSKHCLTILEKTVLLIDEPHSHAYLKPFVYKKYFIFSTQSHPSTDCSTSDCMTYVTLAKKRKVAKGTSTTLPKTIGVQRTPIRSKTKSRSFTQRKRQVSVGPGASLLVD